MSFQDPPISCFEKERFVESLWELHQEISTEVLKPRVDLIRLMRLIGLGVNHCLVGIGNILEETCLQRASNDLCRFRIALGDVPEESDDTYREKIFRNDMRDIDL